MGTYSVAEAKAKLSALIDEAMGGEPVTITRHGHPVAELKPAGGAGGRKPRPMTQADLDWLAERRVGRETGLNAGELVSKMRDEDWK
ncbi:MAG: type II toxin-antitoxin system Phd/YefM family antitoxin [Terricaulis sp.]